MKKIKAKRLSQGQRKKVVQKDKNLQFFSSRYFRYVIAGAGALVLLLLLGINPLFRKTFVKNSSAATDTSFSAGNTGLRMNIQSGIIATITSFQATQQ